MTHNEQLDLIKAIIDETPTFGPLMSLIAEVCSAKANQDDSEYQDWKGYAAGFMAAADAPARVPFIAQA